MFEFQSPHTVKPPIPYNVLETYLLVPCSATMLFAG